MQELRAGNLRQADGGDVAGVLVQAAVHALVDALRLHGHVVEIGLAQVLHIVLAGLAFGHPAAAVLQAASRLPLARHLHEELERSARIRDDADRKSTRLNSSHSQISYAVFCLKKKKTNKYMTIQRIHFTAQMTNCVV